MESNGPKRIGTLYKTFRIIEYLAEHGESGVSKIAEALDMPVSTVHTHLNTLKDIGYVFTDGSIYRLSYRFLNVGGQLRHRSDLYRVAKPFLDGLADETGDLVNLLVEEDGVGVHLYLSQGSEAVELDTYIGRRTPLHVSASGKAILSNLPEERVHEIVEQHGLEAQTDQTITDEPELMKALAEIREQGVAYDWEERLEGLRCAAAPIIVPDKFFGAISVSGPVSRMRKERLSEELPELIQATTDQIELRLRFSTPAGQ